MNLSMTLIALLKGITTRDDDPVLWQALLDLQARVRRAVQHTILTNEMRTWALNRWLDEPGALDGPVRS